MLQSLKKVRNRGVMKSTAPSLSLFGLANTLIGRRNCAKSKLDLCREMTVRDDMVRSVLRRRLEGTCRPVARLEG